MKTYPSLRRWLAVVATVIVFGTVFAAACRKVQLADDAPAPADVAKDEDAKKHAWPLFGGTQNRDMVNTVDKDIPTEWKVQEDAQKKVKWSADLGSKAYGGPVIAGGKIFIGTNNENPKNPKITGDKGVVMCFDAREGKFLWQAVHDKLAAGRVQDWPKEGVCSTPFIDGDHVYYVSNRCEVICATVEGKRDDKTGETVEDVVWRLDMIKDWNVFPHNLATCSPLVVGDTVFVVTSNGVDEGHKNIPQPKAPSFLAINKKDGKVLWHDNSPGENIMHGQWSNPVYADIQGKPQVIFPGGDGYLYAFDPAKGKLLWKFDCNPKKSKYVLGGAGTKSDFLATPVVHDNKLYVGVGQDPEHDLGVGHLWCIDITKEPKGAAKDLSPVNDNFDPKADVNKDSGLVWHYGGAAPEDYDRDYLFGRTMSTVAVHDGLVYAAELEGILHCLDAKTGKHYWEHDLRSKTWSSPYWVDGKVYMGTDGGKVFIFEHGKTKKLINTVDMSVKDKNGIVVRPQIRATPVAVDGIFYVMTENKLYAIK
jgi:outer membrane protein assembly factor BamB